MRKWGYHGNGKVKYSPEMKEQTVKYILEGNKSAICSMLFHGTLITFFKSFSVVFIVRSWSSINRSAPAYRFFSSSSVSVIFFIIPSYFNNRDFCRISTPALFPDIPGFCKLIKKCEPTHDISSLIIDSYDKYKKEPI